MSAARWRTPETHQDVQRVELTRLSLLASGDLTRHPQLATVSSPSGARSRPMPDAAPLPLPLPLSAIADGVAAAFPLDGPIGLRLHRAVIALIWNHHLVAVSSRTHPKKSLYAHLGLSYIAAAHHRPRPLKPDASRAMYARQVTSWVCLGSQR